MKEKREIILFFTRLLMLAVNAGGPVWRDFWNDFCEESGYVPENMCRRSALILQAGTEIFRPGCCGISKRGDIVYRRIVAREKDKVEITDKNELKINGSIVNEPDIFYKTPAYVDGISYPVKVKKDQYFILCDFREGAKDSRYFGAVNAKDIKGRVITVLRRSNL